MKLRIAVGICLSLSVMTQLIQAQQLRGERGATLYPGTDDASRSTRREFAQSIRVNRQTQRGAVIARGLRAPLNGECVYNVNIRVEIYSGGRELALSPRPDCSIVLDDIVDNAVVEPEERAAAALAPGAFGQMRNVAGRLWEALFPTALAQSYVLKRLYTHIYTCGVACSGGIDGLTALQGWTDYRYNGSSISMDAAWEWFCTSGTTSSGMSNCQPPMEVGWSPMNPVNTGWWGYNNWITGRVWGPGSSIYGSAETTFKWTPMGVPPTFIHTLYNQRTVNFAGIATCSTPIVGSWVNGPLRSGCVISNR